MITTYETPAGLACADQAFIVREPRHYTRGPVYFACRFKRTLDEWLDAHKDRDWEVEIVSCHDTYWQTCVTRFQKHGKEEDAVPNDFNI